MRKPLPSIRKVLTEKEKSNKFFPPEEIAHPTEYTQVVTSKEILTTHVVRKHDGSQKNRIMGNITPAAVLQLVGEPFCL